MIPALKVGGAELAMMRLIQSLKLEYQNIKITLLIIGKNQSLKGYDWLHEYCTIKSIPFSFKGRLHKLSGFLYLIYTRYYCFKQNPRKVICFGEFWNVLTLGSLYNSGLDIIISDRSDPQLGYSKTFQYARKYLYPSAHKIILQTQRANKFLLRTVENIEPVVIPNYNAFKPSIQENPVPQGQVQLITASRFIPSKQLNLLIELMSNETIQNHATLTIYGDDDHISGMRRKLEEITVQKGVSGKVIFAGKTHDLNKKMQASDAFLFASNSEGYPNVIMEALSEGIQVYTLFDFNEITQLNIPSYAVCNSMETMEQNLLGFIKNIDEHRKLRFHNHQSTLAILKEIDKNTKESYFEQILAD